MQGIIVALDSDGDCNYVNDMFAGILETKNKLGCDKYFVTA